MGQVFSTQSLNSVSKSVKILQKTITLNKSSSSTTYVVASLSSSDPTIYLGNLISVCVVSASGLKCMFCGSQLTKDSQGKLCVQNFTASVMNANSLSTSDTIYFNITYLGS